MEEYIPLIFFVVDAHGDIFVRSSNSLDTFAKITGTEVNHANSIFDYCLPEEKNPIRQMLNSGGVEGFTLWESQRVLGNDTVWLTWKTRKLFFPEGETRYFLMTLELSLEQSASSGTQTTRDPKSVDEQELLVARLETRLLDLLGDLQEKEQALIKSQTSEQLFKNTFLALPIPAFLWHKESDDDIRLLLVNQAADSLGNKTTHNLVGLNIEDVFFRAPHVANFIAETLLTGNSQLVELIYPLQTDLKEKWVVLETHRLDEQHGLSLFRDITAEKEKLLNEENSRTQTEHLRQAMTTFTSVLNLGELQNRVLSSLRNLIAYDKALLFFLEQEQVTCVAEAGFGEEKVLVGKQLLASNPQFEALNRNRVPLYLSNAQDYRPFMVLEEFNCGKSWLGVPLISHGQIIGYISIYNDLPDLYSSRDADLALTFASEAAIAFENANLFEQLQKMATLDGLTEIYNRRYFFELAEIELRRTRRYQKNLSLVMLDIDNFKRVNDEFGHSYGDKILQKISQCMREEMRESDLVGRYGGEEFIILLPETSLADALEAAERLRKAIESNKEINPQDQPTITVSLGVAGVEGDAHTFDDLIQQADKALYRAKQAGKNRASY